MRNIYMYNDYLKSEVDDLESDNFTRSILKEYFEEEQLKSKWQAILDRNRSSNIGLKENRGKTHFNKSKTFRLLGSILAVAASLLLFFLVRTNTVVVDPLNPVDQLLNEHYSKPYNREVFKGSNDDQSNLDRKAFQFYQEGKYESAILLFEENILKGAESEDVRFYLGLSYLYSKKSNKAITQFEWILNQKVTSYNDAATWYIALAFTDVEKYVEAKKYLTEVTGWDQNKGRRTLANKAKTLLDAMD